MQWHQPLSLALMGASHQVLCIGNINCKQTNKFLRWLFSIRGKSFSQRSQASNIPENILNYFRLKQKQVWVPWPSSYTLSHQVLCLIQQQTLLLHFPFAKEWPAEALLVTLHIPCQIELQLGFSLHNYISACSDNVSIVVQGHLTLLQPLVCLLLMPEFSQELIVHPHRLPHNFLLATGTSIFIFPTILFWFQVSGPAEHFLFSAPRSCLLASSYQCTPKVFWIVLCCITLSTNIRLFKFPMRTKVNIHKASSCCLKNALPSS